MVWNGSISRACRNTPSRNGKRGRSLICSLPISALSVMSPFSVSRRATTGNIARHLNAPFQSTPARGGRLGGRLRNPRGDTFQSTPARGGRLSPPVLARRVLVSIHARTRRATRTGPVRQSGCRWFQSTPARGGRRSRRCVASRIELVSIHARTRRATAGHDAADVRDDVSIHARTRRATRRRPWPARHAMCFNPRPHAAGDVSVSESPAGIHVSIHARTRRATRPATANAQRAACFNPRPHAAGDGRQSRHADAISVSIHARTRRATRLCAAVERPCDDVSIHARTRRATPAVALRQLRQRCFNPRPHAAGDTPITHAVRAP